MKKQNHKINIDVTFRHTESTYALKEYAENKIGNAVKKYVISDADVHVVLEVEKRDHCAEVHLHSRRFDIRARSIAENLYAAIDQVVDNLVTQLRKKKEKIVDYKKGPQVNQQTAI